MSQRSSNVVKIMLIRDRIARHEQACKDRNSPSKERNVDTLIDEIKRILESDEI
jgi:hypothetical protein